MRRLERWLHQHIFKVGWLLTKNLQTTTILYYTFFLPGVVLHQFVYWLVAGILNVRAERAIAWPEAQAIAELKLNFIKLGRSAGRLKIAIISVAPLIGGLAVIWLITNSILNLTQIMTTLRGGTAEDIGAAVGLLLSTPDIWIWVYFIFTVANTMMPDTQSLRGWRPVLIVGVVVIVILYFLGIAQAMFLDTLAIPITEGLSRLALTFGVVIAVDLLVTGVLGSIEALIERITGASATFQNGKLIALTREEMLRQREQQRAKEQRQKQAAKTRAPAGPPSFYKLPLPIPAAPDKDLAEAITVRREDKSALPARTQPTPIPGLASPTTTPTTSAQTFTRTEPDVIPGTVVSKTESDPKPADKPLQEAQIDTPALVKETHVVSDDDEDEEDDVEDVDDEDDDGEEDEEAEERA